MLGIHPAEAGVASRSAAGAVRLDSGSGARRIELRVDADFELLQGAEKGGLEVDLVAVGQHEDGPKTVGQFVRQFCVDVVDATQALFGHDQFGQVTDVADESLHHFLPGPSAAGPGFFQSVETIT